jgi:hypothetical protein
VSHLAVMVCVQTLIQGLTYCKLPHRAQFPNACQVLSAASVVVCHLDCRSRVGCAASELRRCCNRTLTGLGERSLHAYNSQRRLSLNHPDPSVVALIRPVGAFLCCLADEGSRSTGRSACRWLPLPVHAVSVVDAWLSHCIVYDQRCYTWCCSCQQRCLEQHARESNPTLSTTWHHSAQNVGTPRGRHVSRSSAAAVVGTCCCFVAAVDAYSPK